MGAEEPFGLYDSLGYWVNRLANVFSEVFDHSIGHLDVSPPQWVVLISCYNGDATTPGELASFIGIDASAITRLLDRLEAKNLIVRVPDRVDRRSIRVELTESGRSLTPTLARLVQRANGEFVRGIPLDEVVLLRETIRKMLDNAPVG